MNTTHPMPVAEYRQRLVAAMRRRHPDQTPAQRRAAVDDHMATVTEDVARAAIERGN